VAKGVGAAEGVAPTVRTIHGGLEISAAYDSGRLKIGAFGTRPARP
jgi:hypothetical protein